MQTATSVRAMAFEVLPLEPRGPCPRGLNSSWRMPLHDFALIMDEQLSTRGHLRWDGQDEARELPSEEPNRKQL